MKTGVAEASMLLTRDPLLLMPPTPPPFEEVAPRAVGVEDAWELLRSRVACSSAAAAEAAAAAVAGLGWGAGE